jgi:hypothetical protein
MAISHQKPLPSPTVPPLRLLPLLLFTALELLCFVGIVLSRWNCIVSLELVCFVGIVLFRRNCIVFVGLVLFGHCVGILDLLVCIYYVL